MEQGIEIRGGKILTFEQIDKLPVSCSLNCCFGGISDCDCGDCKCCLPAVIISWENPQRKLA